MQFSGIYGLIPRLPLVYMRRSMQFSGIYGLIPRLPLVLHEEEEGGHTSGAEIKLLLCGGFLYIQPSFPGSSKHLSYHIAGNFRGRKLLQITDFSWR